MKKIIEYFKAFLLFLAVAVVSGVVVMKVAMYTGGESVETPDIRGKKIITALETLNQRGLYLKVTRLDDNSLVEKDRIISQVPEPKTLLKKGRGVKVVISRGSKEILTPNLKGVSLRKASLLLKQNDIKIRKKVFIHSKTPKDFVLDQKPAPGTKMFRGDSVVLLASSGLFPSYILMPDFVDKDISEVMDRLKDLDLLTGRVSYEPSAEKERGVVIRQDPPFSSRAERGSYITLTVSEGALLEGSYKTPTLSFLYYTTPEGPSAMKVMMTQENLDGEKEVYNRVHMPGDNISLLVRIKGQTTVKIFLDNELAEVRRY